MSYDPLFDAAKKATDDVLGAGEYARLNRNNPGVPRKLRELDGTVVKCHCGSGLESRQLFDARDIYCARVCDKCEASVKASFRPDIFTDRNYHTDEPVEEG